MPAETKKQIQLEIAHVLFMDIVGYSKVLMEEQHALLETLNRIVRNTQQFRDSERAGKLIKIPTGDGMALVFQDSLDAPVECALEISRVLKDHPTLPLRMGVHSGPVSGVIDVSERANVTGAGINMAQRVMDCGDAGHILLSKHVAEVLEQYARWKPFLHDLGECEVKHGVRVHVVSLYTNEIGNAEPPEKFKNLRENTKRGIISLAHVSKISDGAKSLIDWGKRRRTAVVCVGATLIIALCWLGISIFSSRTTRPENLPDSTETTGKPLNLQALENKARGAVTFIQGYDSAGRIVKTGSGFFITSDGRLVTNNHVIQDTAMAQAKLQSGAIYNIKGVLASSERLDLAVLQADARDVQVLLVDSSTTPPEPGTRIAVIGSPLAMEGSLSEGIVAANRAGEDESWLQITAPISPGSSGSPVLDRHGSVLGVATLVAQQGQNINFARSARDLWNFLHTIPADAKPRPLDDVLSWQKNRILADPDFIKAKDDNDRGDAAAALQLLNPLAKRYPGDSRLVFQLALAYEALGFHDEAYQNYRTYIELEPTDVVGWRNFATVAANLNRINDAINACKQALKLKQDIETWRLLAELYKSQGQLDLSNDAMQKANQLALNNLTPQKRQNAVQQADSLESQANGRPIYIVVAPKETNLRSDHSATSAIIEKLKQGDFVFLENEKIQNNEPPHPTTWQKVTTVIGSTGWIAFEYLAPAREPNEKNTAPARELATSSATSSPSPSQPPVQSWDRPHIYLQIPDEDQRTLAKNLEESFQKSNYVVAGIQNVAGNEGIPSESAEVRFFTPTDSAEAHRIAKEVSPFFGKRGVVAYLPEGVPYVSHARQYEVWLPFGANTPEVQSTSDEDAVQQLCVEWLRVSNSANCEQEASLYAETVDYLDYGKLNHQQLLKELLKDRQLWPKQHYTSPKPPLVDKINNSEWRVAFDVDFDVRNLSTRKQVKGTATLTWIVGKRGSDGFEIKSSKEKVTSRIRRNLNTLQSF